MSSTEARERALNLAVAWANGAGIPAGNCAASDVINAAESFIGFLNGDSRPASTPTALNLHAAWSDPNWRQVFLQDICEAVQARMTWQACAESIGEFTELEWDERAIVKGTVGLTAFWLGDDDILSVLSEEAAWEIPRRVAIEAVFDRAEHEMTADLADGKYGLLLDRVADAVATKINADVKVALRSLLIAAAESAGLEEDRVDLVVSDQGMGQPPLVEWACAPFRVVTAQFGSALRAKEWVSEGDDVWHLTVKVQFGAAAFVPPVAP